MTFRFSASCLVGLWKVLHHKVMLTTKSLSIALTRQIDTMNERERDERKKLWDDFFFKQYLKYIYIYILNNYFSEKNIFLNFFLDFKFEKQRLRVNDS
jgi:hypothetical protein